MTVRDSSPRKWGELSLCMADRPGHLVQGTSIRSPGGVIEIEARALSVAGALKLHVTLRVPP